MRFATMAAVAAMVLSGSVFAQTFNFNSAQDWLPNKNVTSKDGVITVKGKRALYGKKMFAVDRTKTYTFSWQCRTTGDAPVWCLFGVQCYDAKGKELSSMTSNAFAGTDTVLTAELKKGAKVIVVKDASKWPGKGTFGLVSGAKAKYADLPNFNWEWITIVKKEKKGASWEVTLRNPIKKVTGKAACGVRLHRPGGYYYVGGGASNFGKTWAKHGGSAKGFAPDGVFGRLGWPKGTVKARIIILSDWNSKNQDVQFQKISLTVK